MSQNPKPMRKPPPTIRDVANRAGVSLGTASQVLNGKGKVSELRRDLVLQAASTLGYRPNHLARGLRQQRTNVIGLVAPMISSAYFASFIEAVDAASAALGYHVIQVLTGGDPRRERERVESLLSRQVDGIILMPTSEPTATLDLLSDNHIPAVIVDRILDEGRFDLVLLDHQAAMVEAIDHLVALGHQRLLFVVRNPALITTRQRIQTLERAVAAARGRLHAQVIATTQEDYDLPNLFRTHLSGATGATAIITSNSINTLAALRTLREFKIRIPEDVSVVAFDEPVWSALIDPPLTVVKQPTEHIASVACRLLVAKIMDPNSPRQRIVLQNRLITRASTAAPKRL